MAGGTAVGGKPGPRSVQIIRGVLKHNPRGRPAKGYIFVKPMANVRRFDVRERELHYLDVPQLKQLCESVGAFYGCSFSWRRSLVENW